MHSVFNATKKLIRKVATSLGAYEPAYSTLVLGED